MRFSEVLPALEAGKRVRARWWAKEAHVSAVDGNLTLNCADGGEGKFTLLDLLATDWEVVEEPEKAVPCSNCACYSEAVARLTRELEEARGVVSATERSVQRLLKECLSLEGELAGRRSEAGAPNDRTKG